MPNKPFDFTSSEFDASRVEGFTTFYELDDARFVLDNEEQAKYYVDAYGGFSFKWDSGVYSVQGGKLPFAITCPGNGTKLLPLSFIAW